MTFTTPSPESPQPPQPPQWGAAPPAAPPGWHADPWRVAPWRWFDGYQWTAHVWPPTSPPTDPLGGPQPTTRSMRRAFWPSVGWMLLAMLAGVVAALPLAFAVVLLGAGEPGVTLSVVIVVYPVMFGGFWFASRRLSRRYGTGDMRVDYGWRRFRWADIGWGVLAAFAALVAQVLIGLVVRRPEDDSYREAVFGTDPSVLLLVVMGLAIVIGAPVFEELMFRGPFMRSLIARFGTWPGLVLQGAVFALYHVVGNPTLITLWYLTPLFAVGIIFGIAAHRTGRMATAQIAHAVQNTVAFIGLLASL